jgi:pimeloyl-ACP methyl ester carboxylesterase/ketosteroid isomerase-like protein
MTFQVIALPGGVMPAAARYASLAAKVGDMAQLHTKDLEVYAGKEPPAEYSIQTEVEAVARFADSLGLSRFHLVGYSGGGFVSLAFAGAHPERLLSLALFEPASIPGQLSAEEAMLYRRLDRELAGRSGPEFMRSFMTLQIKEGVEIPPPVGPPPPWMGKRPAGLAAMMKAFGAHPFDRESLRRCEFPVFLGYGDLTGAHEEIRAGILARLLPDVAIRRFPGVHHFVAPEEIYSPEHVAALQAMWSRTNEQVVRKFYELFSQRDFDRALAMFTDDAEFHVPGGNAISGNHRGPNAILAFWRRQLELSHGSFKARLVSKEPKNDHVLVALDVSSDVAGRPTAWRRTVDYRLAGGLIAEATVVESDQSLADRVFGG